VEEEVEEEEVEGDWVSLLAVHCGLRVEVLCISSTGSPCEGDGRCFMP